MGQTQCCQARASNTHSLNPKLAFSLINFQDDPLQTQEANPIYLTSRSTKRKKLGDIEEGQFLQSRPQMKHEIRQRLANLKSIEQECYLRLKNERGISEPNRYFKFHRTGIVYEGQWYNSKPHGYGKNYYPNEGYFQGTFINGIPHGYGRFINPNGDYYEGQIKLGRGNGQGYYYAGKIIYHGQFKDNILHGQGEEKGEDYYFKGSYEFGEKKKGFLKYSGNNYEGGFQNDVFYGKGTLMTEEGKYQGQFQNGLQHGYGQFLWKNGSKYRGRYKRGLRDGDGEYFNSDNKSIYRGLWNKGNLQGDGQFIQSRGTKNKVIWNDSRVSAIK